MAAPKGVPVWVDQRLGHEVCVGYWPRWPLPNTYLVAQPPVNANRAVPSGRPYSSSPHMSTDWYACSTGSEHDLMMEGYLTHYVGFCYHEIFVILLISLVISILHTFAHYLIFLCCIYGVLLHENTYALLLYYFFSSLTRLHDYAMFLNPMLQNAHPVVTVLFTLSLLSLS